MSCSSSQANTRRILLRPVNSSRMPTHRYKKILESPIKLQRNFYKSQDQIQLISNSEIVRVPKQKDLQSLKFNLIEDPRQSQFSYRKYMILQKILLVLTVFYIFLCIIRTQMGDQVHYKSQSFEDQKLIIIMNIITLGIITSIFMRSVCLNQLRIDQKKVYCVRRQLGLIADIGRFLKNKNELKIFFIQLLVTIIHPTLITKNVKIKLTQSFDQIVLIHDLNDIFCLVSLWRVYLILRSLVNITDYATPRAVRLCNYNRIDHNAIYSIKCLLQEKPLFSIFVVFITQQLILGYAMRLSEGNVHKQNPNIPLTGFQSYYNCFWCVFITMATVGYGDYYPKTIGGRAVSFLAAISGIIVCSLLIVSLSAYLTMQPSQTSSHLTLIRLHHQKKLKEQATEALIQTMKLSQCLTGQQKINDVQKIKKIFTILKQKIDTVKYRSRKIKSLVNNNNIMQQMNRLFEVLRQSLSQLFRNQVKLKEDLLKMNEKKPRKMDRKKMETLLLGQNAKIK